MIKITTFKLLRGYPKPTINLDFMTLYPNVIVNFSGLTTNPCAEIILPTHYR